MFKLVLEKAEEPEIKSPPQGAQFPSLNNSLSLLTMPKPLTAWITTNWKILKEMGIPDYLTCLQRNMHAGQEATIRTGHGKTDWFKTGKEVFKAVYCYPAYLTYIQDII